LGDALGFVVESQPPEVARAYVDEWLRAGRASERAHSQYRYGQYSDDTQLARELLRSFQEKRGWDPSAFAGRLAQLFRDRRDVGAGQGTRSAALRLLMGVPWFEAGTPAPYAGNGSAMRAGPLGLLFSDRPTICRTAREQSRITHRDPRCAAGAVVVACAVSIAGRREPIETVEFLVAISDRISGGNLRLRPRGRRFSGRGGPWLDRVASTESGGGRASCARERTRSRPPALAGDFRVRHTQCSMEPIQLPSVSRRLLGDHLHCYRRRW
jgi:hypothetical protein